MIFGPFVPPRHINRGSLETRLRALLFPSKPLQCQCGRLLSACQCTRRRVPNRRSAEHSCLYGSCRHPRDHAESTPSLPNRLKHWACSMVLLASLTQQTRHPRRQRLYPLHYASDDAVS